MCASGGGHYFRVYSYRAVALRHDRHWRDLIFRSKRCRGLASWMELGHGVITELDARRAD